MLKIYQYKEEASKEVTPSQDKGQSCYIRTDFTDSILSIQIDNCLHKFVNVYRRFDRSSNFVYKSKFINSGSLYIEPFLTRTLWFVQHILQECVNVKWYVITFFVMYKFLV